MLKVCVDTKITGWHIFSGTNWKRSPRGDGKTLPSLKAVGFSAFKESVDFIFDVFIVLNQFTNCLNFS